MHGVSRPVDQVAGESHAAGDLLSAGNACLRLLPSDAGKHRGAFHLERLLFRQIGAVAPEAIVAKLRSFCEGLANRLRIEGEITVDSDRHGLDMQSLGFFDGNRARPADGVRGGLLGLAQPHQQQAAGGQSAQGVEQQRLVGSAAVVARLEQIDDFSRQRRILESGEHRQIALRLKKIARCHFDLHSPRLQQP